MSRFSNIVMIAQILLVGLIGASSASAQIAVTPSAVTPVVGPVISPWFFGGGSYGGGTADGNFLFGLAQVIRAEGDYNLETSQALPNIEAARSQYIDNVSKWAQVSSRMVEANQAYRAQQLERNRHSPETLTQVAASSLPRDLTVKEFDPATGLIDWPEALMDDRYSSLRTDLERLFEIRAWTGRDPGTTTKIRDDLRQVQEILRSNIDMMPASDYLAARTFIDSLDYAVIARSKPGRSPDHLARLGR